MENPRQKGFMIYVVAVEAPPTTNKKVVPLLGNTKRLMEQGVERLIQHGDVAGTGACKRCIVLRILLRWRRKTDVAVFLFLIVKYGSFNEKIIDSAGLAPFNTICAFVASYQWLHCSPTPCLGQTSPATTALELHSHAPSDSFHPKKEMKAPGHCNLRK